jgi:hypothetical protein
MTKISLTTSPVLVGRMVGGGAEGAGAGVGDGVVAGELGAADGVEILAVGHGGGAVGGGGAFDGDAAGAVVAGGAGGEPFQRAGQGGAVGSVVVDAAAGLGHAGELAAGLRADAEADGVDADVDPVAATWRAMAQGSPPQVSSPSLTSTMVRGPWPAGRSLAASPRA